MAGQGLIEPATPAQIDALSKLATVVDATTYLVGGVAIAFHLHHRQSKDLDLFTSLDPAVKCEALAASGLGVRVVSQSEGTLHLELSGVPVSWLRYRYPLLSPVENIPGVPIPVASLDDEVAMKLSAIAGRGAARDFWDLHEMLVRRGTSLEDALRLFERKYAAQDVGHVLKSLTYFTDAEAAPLPTGLSVESWRAIRSQVEDWVRAL